MRDLVILLAWIIMIPALWSRPFVGVLLWTWTAFLSPNSYVYGFLASVPFNKVIAIYTTVIFMISPEPKKVYWNSTLVLLIILLGQGTISYMLSVNNSA